jgi:alanyl-tRNA synthetase
MTPQEVEKTEALMNKWIGEKLPVQTEVMDIEEAKLTGATALFGEKYDDVVRVVSIGGAKKCKCGGGCKCKHDEEPEVISREFCAGTHAKSTGDLRLVKIVSEGAIAAGTRRIELVVSKAAIEYLNNKVKVTNELESRFKVHTEEVLERVEKLAEENRELQKELARVKEEQAKGKFATFISRAQDIEGGKLFISKIENFDADAVKAGIELLGNKLGDSVIVLASEKMVIAKVSESFVQKGINAGKIVGEIARATGANGGGRPNFAQGGVKDASMLDDILAKIEADIKG